jgi:hypothetical protein
MDKGPPLGVADDYQERSLDAALNGASYDGGHCGAGPAVKRTVAMDWRAMPPMACCAGAFLPTAGGDGSMEAA